MPPKATKTPVPAEKSFWLKNLTTNSEEFVEVDENNVGLVMMKDKILADLCEINEIEPTFVEITSAKGKKFIVLSNSATNELVQELLK